MHSSNVINALDISTIVHYGMRRYFKASGIVALVSMITDIEASGMLRFVNPNSIRLVIYFI